ncbi:3-oxoacyl-ACP reductase FabG [Polluticoccus soli]|uniref:3-oxoacyl-ACP reductase FabG n=1 Tax=Polluticoccus soli TaxID=3034150 RepID=UPI0023E286BD|nr:3-oxoacyl-ACP reductase FabG [Flavipsychrobacter sp. JY13-12]
MKYALVTGGSRGIGRACCLKLAELGYNILINYKGNRAAAEETASLIEPFGVKTELLAFDVADKDSVQEELGGWIDANKDNLIEVLVNNAGIRQDTLLMSMTDEQWGSVLDTSLRGMYNVTKQVLNPMLLNRYGRIINMVSLSGLKGMPGQVNYSAAKAGMIGATKALAQEIAKRNITVNAIAPGFIKTDMTEELNEKELINLIPMKRFGVPEEVAELVGFFASKNSSYITGQVVSINGGLYT